MIGILDEVVDGTTAEELAARHGLELPTPCRHLSAAITWPLARRCR